MAKETKQQIIERLEKELWEYKVLTSKLQKEIYEMQDVEEGNFLNSPEYVQMSKRIEKLELENKILKGQLEHKENIHKLKIEQKVHNERGAGRNKKFTDKEVTEIKNYRADGKTIREIAQLYQCSIGLVHKLINENQSSLQNIDNMLK